MTEVEITEARFNELLANLTPGTFTVVASDGRVVIRGLYVDYVWRRA